MSTVSGVIESKEVKNGPYGDRVKFRVGGQTLSAFANDQYLSQEVKGLLRELQTGDEAEFTIKENTGKDGKTYKNIIGIVRVTRIGGDTGEKMDYSVKHSSETKPESNRSDKEQPDTKIRSMALAYAKDLVAAGNLNISELYTMADQFIAYIKGEQDKYDYRGE